MENSRKKRDGKLYSDKEYRQIIEKKRHKPLYICFTIFDIAIEDTPFNAFFILL